MRSIRSVSARWITLAVLLPTALISNANELERTWLQGAFLLPLEMASKTNAPKNSIARIDRFSSGLLSLESEKKYPIAILMHGCSGITSENTAAAKKLASFGFVVFLPNHFARSDAATICAGSAAGVPFFARFDRRLLAQRVAEFNYALERARALPFTNPESVLAFGHSMGGATVANLDREDVQGTIITGWACASPWHGQSRGRVPQLAIRFQDDPWMPQGWDCGVKPFSGREHKNTNSLILDGQTTHEVMHDARAVSAIDEFLNLYFQPLKK